MVACAWPSVLHGEVPLEDEVPELVLSEALPEELVLPEEPVLPEESVLPEAVPVLPEVLPVSEVVPLVAVAEVSSSVAAVCSWARTPKPMTPAAATATSPVVTGPTRRIPCSRVAIVSLSPAALRGRNADW
ncbi:hypothetical protein FF36_02947 [Frankia torreyi]|uniref:Uncharacterized protein n=1 Tax=Frankia torreyi TaxID=1856 RepID=A0A0D8BEU9_9ACTN|nr:hypothetical protein [Frankia torreyi]KJE22768.1 hypothetical protein FF36_02947 [Frankia torreyi]